MSKTVMLPQQTRAVSLRAESYDPDDNSIEVVFTTGAAVQRYSWGDGPYVESLDVTPKAVRLDRLNAGAPFLNTHSDWDLGDVLGSVVPGTARIMGGEGLARVRLSNDPAKAGIVGDIRDGIIRNVSVGYLIHEAVWTEAKDGASASCRVTDWEPIEISAVPIPADFNAQVRSAGDANARGERRTYAARVLTETPAAAIEGQQAGAGQEARDETAAARSAETTRVRGILATGRSLGLPGAMVDAAVDDGSTIEAFHARAIDWRGANPPTVIPTSGDAATTPSTPPAASAADSENRTMDPVTIAPAAVAAPAPAPAAAVDAASVRTAERTRIAEIRTTARKLGLPDTTVDEAIDAGVSIEAFRASAIEAVAARQADGQFRVSLPASDPAAHRSYAQPAEKLAPGTQASRAILALAACRGSKRDAADFVDKHYGISGTDVARALTTSIGSAGGFLVPDAMATEVIELLRPKSAVMALGPTIIPMPNGNFSMGRQTGGASASYVGETNNIAASQPSYGKMQLSAKKLAALVALSNDMIRFPSAAVDALVRKDMVAAIAQYTDFAFIRGSGSQFSPKGLRYLAADPVLGGNNVIHASATVSLATVTSDLGALELALANANIPMEQPGWIMSWRTRNFLYNLRDGLGNQVFAAEMARGELRGKPFRATTQVPNNLAAVDASNNATTDGSEITLADFSEVFIGEAYGLEFEVFPGGAYVDATGQLISGISTDETVMRALVQHDINMRQQSAVAVLDRVRWF